MGVSIKSIKDQLQGDDSILIDTSAITADGAVEFFSQLIEALPKIKDTYLIIPNEAIVKINARMESKNKKVADQAIRSAEWLQKAVNLSDGDDFKVIIVGDSEGAFEDKTILNQVKFLLPQHNIMLITQDLRMTVRARNLRDPATQGNHKLHCCMIRPEGKLGLYQIPVNNASKN